MNISQTIRHWRQGIRLYVALVIGLVTLETWWWANASFAGSSLFSIRLEESYAWFSVSCLAIALAIGPACKVFRNLPYKQQLFESRRMFGIGAAWFASLHAAVAYVSLFKLSNPLSLPNTYRYSFLYASIALVILLAMALTSFDWAMRGMGKNWYRLHRLVYAAGLLTLLHAFMSGTHAARPNVLIALGVVCAALIGMQVYVAFRRLSQPSAWRLVALGALVILTIAVFYFGFTERSQFVVKPAASTSNGGSYQ